MRKFIALYIDLENVSGVLDLDRMLQDIILEDHQDEAEEYIFAVKIACGNNRSIAKLRSHLVNHNFEIREAPHVTGKKNRADLIISLDAFEKLYLNKPAIDRFVFVTSDSDFSVIMDLLRKHGKEVWLITKESDENRPIFTNCTDNIMTIPQKRKPADKSAKKPARTEGAQLKVDGVDLDAQNGRDLIAEELFTKVLISLDPSQNHLLNTIANKMKQLDKSFKIKNTSYKRMNALARRFEMKGWFKTEKNKDGHLMVKDLSVLK